MTSIRLTDESGSFQTDYLEATEPRRLVLFAVGAGGDPLRHLPLLELLSRNGVSVVAPHFERISPNVTETDLLLRARRLRLAIEAVASPGIAVIGVGHSIGATVLLSMAGAQAYWRAGQPIAIDREPRLRRLVLLTPPTGYFAAPGALDGVETPILIRAGAKDTITPPWQAELINRALSHRVPVDLRIEEQAGHFSFMHTPPPHAVETLPDRDEFLTRLSAEILNFATAS